MRAEINRRFPQLAMYLQPKCGERRMGYCDESLKDWEACPIGRKRPHKSQLFELFNAYRRGEDRPLDDADFRVIAEVPGGDQVID
jgi:thymidylate synthase (FAD)